MSGCGTQSMRTLMMSSTLAVIGLGGLTSTNAHADIIRFSSDISNRTEGLGLVEGMIQYHALSDDLGQLTVELTNTSDPTNGGFITGFLFNIDNDDPSNRVVLTDETYPFALTIGQRGAPFGSHYDAGAALGGDWLGGGSPVDGVAIGDIGQFVFDIYTTGARHLQASSFLGERGEFNFLVRFRGFDDGGSDKVPVPAPGSLALFACSMFLTGFRTRRRDG